MTISSTAIIVACVLGAALTKTETLGAKNSVRKTESSRRGAYGYRAPEPKTMLVYVGTYTQHGSKGIYLFGLNMQSGHLSPMGLAGEATDVPIACSIQTDRCLCFHAE